MAAAVVVVTDTLDVEGATDAIVREPGAKASALRVGAEDAVGVPGAVLLSVAPGSVCGGSFVPVVSARGIAAARGAVAADWLSP
jgi:hypothetical protein